MRVLVSGASGIVGYGILRTLSEAKFISLLVGTSIYDDSVAPAFCDVFVKAPHTQSPEYGGWLLSVLETYKIDVLIPGIEADMYFWNQNSCEIQGVGAFPLLNQSSLIELCKDKWIFYNKLLDSGVSCAIESSISEDFSKLASKFGPRILLKPRQGFGSKGIAIVTSAEEFEQHQKNSKAELMAQPVIGSDEQEFTTAVFCDGEGGYFSDITLRRRLSNAGFTDRAEVVSTDYFREAIDQLCALLHPIGPTNFQFRMSNEGPKLLEINPRISSSTSIRAAFGYNESVMAIDYFLNQKQPRPPAIKHGHAIRYTTEHIFYEDSIHI
ncbi:ATP-grasp domain-containing protein [Luminiphilus sp. nBUS_16]|uniref:ATP-grasp domain-containing protein n=1 Tax=Luminiphilus sp. nBUS_16 TaxID=3395315 RepID=UPI003EC0DC2B